MITDRDRHDVMAWRGLDARVLGELDGLSRAAVEAGDMVKYHTEALRSRARCLELRAEHGLGLFEKLRTT